MRRILLTMVLIGVLSSTSCLASDISTSTPSDCTIASATPIATTTVSEVEIEDNQELESVFCTTKNYKGITIIQSDKVDDTTYNEFLSDLDRLNSSILDFIKSKNITITVINPSEHMRSYTEISYDVRGQYLLFTNNICLKYTHESFYSLFMHELGHAFDDCSVKSSTLQYPSDGLCSYTDLWKNLYNNTYDEFFNLFVDKNVFGDLSSQHYHQSEFEYFAQCFAIYNSVPRYMEKTAPNTYKAIRYFCELNNIVPNNNIENFTIATGKDVSNGTNDVVATFDSVKTLPLILALLLSAIALKKGKEVNE